MNVQGIAPTLLYAEQHSHYLPWPEDPHVAEARRISEIINKTKVQDPDTGIKIYDSLVDSLVAHTLAIVNKNEHMPEPSEWTPPQRCVWRFSNLPYERRYVVVSDNSLNKDVKAFASVNSGRWVVLCPFPGCHGAQYASFTDRRFFCVDCNNKAVLQQWLEVVWPEDHLAIENWLSQRPLNAKHWVPGETADDISAQDATALGRG